MSSVQPTAPDSPSLSVVSADVRDEVGAAYELASAAQSVWRATSLTQRLQVVRRFRHQLAEEAEVLAATVTYSGRRTIAETLSAELIPLADACKFLEEGAKQILKPQRIGRRGRPGWLTGVSLEKRWEPFGKILILGAANYPLFLVGVQALQALVAGNVVLISPGRDGVEPLRALERLLLRADLPPGVLNLLPGTKQSVDEALSLGVDKLVLTGAFETGQAILQKTASHVLPSAMELSGCDAVFVQEDADLSRVAKALAFGLTFNSSATCIAPRRVFVHHRRHAELKSHLVAELSARLDTPPFLLSQRTRELVDSACAAGAELIYGQWTDAAESLYGPAIVDQARPSMELFQNDVFESVMGLFTYEDEAEALSMSQACPYALGATVFGGSQAAQTLAQRIDAGCVVVNDMIAPTADPRVAFGGRHASGFGVTRGAEGLREMTQLKTIITRCSRWLPHLEPPAESDQDILAGYLSYAHGANWKHRFAGLRRLLRAIGQSRRKPT